VPLRLYNSGRNIKLEIALVRGKKKVDKRENIKERDTKRDIERTLKNQY
jgi:SsrA-binding protein